jgi:exopolyphosphatase / guanosine-5'-triphosphate,3'-diphosphate pyrophosphatase
VGFVSTATVPRYAVVDLGSNSVRLVVFEGETRNPSAIFNEKAVLRLGRGLQETGRLNDEAVAQALLVMNRYHALAHAMGALCFEVLATAAVRDAENGREFVADLSARMPGVPIRILTGAEEAGLSATGVLCGIPAADGILADIGGGSLELVGLREGVALQAETLSLGVIRLAERAGYDVVKARAVAEADLTTVPWLAQGDGRDLYVVGGTWRALAHIHIEQTGYPLKIVHHYTIAREEARDLAGLIAAAPRRTLERMPGVPRRRIDDLPFAALVLRRLLRATGARRVVFSANGLREGWYMRHVPEEVRQQDAMLAAARELGERLGRHPNLPPALCAWSAPLFAPEDDDARRMREAACWLSDIGSHEHPDYRAEQAFLRVLRQPGVALDHHARAFLATVLALRYDADLDAPFLQPARMLLDPVSLRRAECLGIAFRLAYTLSGGTPDLLAAGTLRRENGALSLELREASGVFAGESVTRRLERLAEVLGLETRMAA